MFFGALFAMYFTNKSGDSGIGKPWPGAVLNYPLATTNTIVLILSSVTCQLGGFAVERGQMKRLGPIWNVARWRLREWYVLSFLMGLYFVLGQGYAYLALIFEQHLTLSSTGYRSVCFLRPSCHVL